MPLTNAPRLHSEELILRGPELQDAEPIIAFLQDERRSTGFGPSARTRRSLALVCVECGALAYSRLWLFHD